MSLVFISKKRLESLVEEERKHAQRQGFNQGAGWAFRRSLDPDVEVQMGQDGKPRLVPVSEMEPRPPRKTSLWQNGDIVTRQDEAATIQLEPGFVTATFEDLKPDVKVALGAHQELVSACLAALVAPEAPETVKALRHALMSAGESPPPRD